MKELIVKAMQHALVEHAPLIPDDLMLSNDGVFVFVPENMTVTKPIHIMHDHKSNNVNNLIVLGNGSSATIVEEYNSDVTEEYTINSVTEILLHDNAKLVHYKIHNDGQEAIHNSKVNVRQASGSNFINHLMSSGAKNSTSIIEVYLQGVLANCYLNGLYIPSFNQKMSLSTIVHHEVECCTSEQDYKGIVNGSAKASFEGSIIVDKFAKQTVAKQQNKNLLLSKTAEVYTKPQLEIYADDVVCTHGATVGQVDEEALFYFATRGVMRNDAIKYLVNAFAASNINYMSDPVIIERMYELMSINFGDNASDS